MEAPLNSRQQGATGVGEAIAHFSALGYSVSIPLGDCQRYDLVVDDGDRLYRVECKTSRFLLKSGGWEVGLATKGGNQSWNGVAKKLSSEDCDLVFILTGDGQRYILPIEELDGRSKITVGNKYLEYKI